MSAPSTDPLAALAGEARRGLAERFKIAPRWVAAAPGRVNVIGEHTDYNDGFVLPMAIDKHVVLAAGPSPATSDVAELWSQSLGETVRLPVQGSPKGSVPHWASYLQGVLAGFLERGVAVPPFQAVIVSDIPLGAGLSSSAALEVGMATLLEGVTNTRLAPRDKARIARQAEHDYAGVPCGIMDQLASVMGRETGPVLIDCRDESVTPVAMPASSPQSPGDAPVLLICDSHVKHSLGDGAYARRRAECEEAARLLGARSLRDVSSAQIAAAEAQLGPLLT
ncbi:MAG TPA: galactokinase family protein, partial [Polyangia bacterium]